MATLSESAQRIRPGVFAELQARIDAHAAKGGTLVPLQIGDTHLAPPTDARFTRAIGDDAKDELYRYGATAGLARMNMILHNYPTAIIEPGNTLSDQQSNALADQ